MGKQANDGTTECHHARDCEMYQVFSNNTALEVLKITYCRGNFTSCARYKMTAEGRTVPRELLPSGQTLTRRNKPVR